LALVTFTNPKGGSSKTTSAFLLASCLAARGERVALVDSDPNAPLLRLEKLRNGNPIKNLSFHRATQDTMYDVVDPLADRVDWVIVDTEGTANMTVGMALNRSDLAIIPIGMSRLDIDQAAKAIRLVQTQSRGIKREIPYRLLFTRANPMVAVSSEKAIRKDVSQSSIATLDVKIIHRAAYTAIFEYNQTLWELDPRRVSGLPMAIENAERFTDSVVSALLATLQGAAA